MKPYQFTIIIAALGLIGAGVWYPTYQRSVREHEAAIALAKTKRLNPLIEAHNIVDNWFGFEVPKGSAQRFDYAHFTVFKPGIRLSELSREAEDQDAPPLRALSELYLSVYEAMDKEPKDDALALVMVKAVKAADQAFPGAKQAFEDRLELARK